MSAKEEFFASLREEWAPDLRRHGFKGSRQRFYRDLGGVVHSIAVRVSKYGDSCGVELGVHPVCLPLTTGEPAVEPRGVIPEASEFRRFLAPLGRSAFEWSFEDGAPGAQYLARTFWKAGEPELRRLDTVEAVAELIRREDLFAVGPVSPWYLYTPPRAALAMARLHAYLGQTAESRAFAAAGLAVGDPRGLRSELEAIAGAA